MDLIGLKKLKGMPEKFIQKLNWLDLDILPKVTMFDSNDCADKKVLESYIHLFIKESKISLPKEALVIREFLNKDSLGEFGKHLYNSWKNSGAEAKYSGVITLAAIDGGNAFVDILRKDMAEWAECSRGALAAKAVQSMALEGGKYALMVVDSISKKFKNKQVKKSAEEAFALAAEILGVEPEVLADRIIPTLGFDNRGEQIIDYGNRHFKAIINPSLEITLKDENEKVIKSLPSPNLKDDQDKALNAKKSFSELKKSLKNIISIQCIRLEAALSSNRTWNKNEWRSLFVENPIMNMFAIGLVWGKYNSSGELIESFRYMEDGSFTNVDEEEVILVDEDNIGLCHPLDLKEELVSKWTNQLNDYEIKQPIEQLDRKVFIVSNKNKEKKSIEDFAGFVLYNSSIIGKMTKLYWQKGEALDAGIFERFYKIDKKQDIIVILSFSGTSIAMYDLSEEVAIYNIYFQTRSSKMDYYRIDESDCLKLSEVPPRLYSEICYDIQRVVDGALRRDADYKTKNYF